MGLLNADVKWNAKKVPKLQGLRRTEEISTAWYTMDSSKYVLNKLTNAYSFYFI